VKNIFLCSISNFTPFGKELFNISPVLLPEFFGNPSGVSVEISKVSRRTPEEPANKT
jgi:hypothetical protein